MVSTSKILTVSYGTFSCTLEGFDDAFETMKAIAEYFRDLAGDDRYFGAEPPTPDAEMLARIAEREISRRVEARDADGRIHLRAGALPAAPQTAATDRPAPDAAPAPDAERAADPQISARKEAAAAATEPAGEAATWPAPAPSPAAHADGDSIADKLRRIRAVASPAASAISAAAYDEDETGFLSSPDFEKSQPDQTPDADPANQQDAASVPARTTAADEASAPPRQEEAAQQEDSAEQEATDAEREENHDDARENADDYIAAQHSDPSDLTDADTAPVAEEQEQPAPDATDEMLARLIAPEAPQVADAEEAPEMAQSEEPEHVQDALDRLLGAEPDEEDDDLDEAVGGRNAEDPIAQLLADALRDDSPSEEDDAPSERAEAAAEDDSDAVLESAADEEDDDEFGAASETAVSEPNAAPRPSLLARVFKLKRADLDAALAKARGERTDSDGDRPDISTAAEADLRRELAEAEAELRQPRALQDRTPHAARSGSGSDGARVAGIENALRRARAQDAPDAQASRIFDEADSQLGAPESNKRRSAIQHLRAAVAATRAERRAGGEMQEDVDDQPYREDLKNAVRPRRPQAVTAATPRPGTQPSRPAPLKLVAEQRIDAPSQPVRPRRITRADLGAPQTRTTATSWRAEAGAPHHSGGFADYANKMGANNLTDLLEAAAAYLADVEGAPNFSRPMLMQKLREAHEDDFTREEGLRSFGQLLRQGKLQKLKGGRFAVTKETEFRRSA